jgi:hypothetical protein
MTRLNYRTPQRKTAGPGMSEFAGPLALLVIGLLIYGIAAFVKAGTTSAFVLMGVIFLMAAIETVLGIVAAFITASVMSTSFGELRTAVLKLAAILVFSSAIAFVVPYFGGIISLAIYAALLMGLFGLELIEAIVFSVIFWLIRMGVVVLLAGLLR